MYHDREEIVAKQGLTGRLGCRGLVGPQDRPRERYGANPAEHVAQLEGSDNRGKYEGKEIDDCQRDSGDSITRPGDQKDVGNVRPQQDAGEGRGSKNGSYGCPPRSSWPVVTERVTWKPVKFGPKVLDCVRVAANGMFRRRSVLVESAFTRASDR